MDFKSELISLGDRFMVNGVIGGELTPVLEGERKFSENVVQKFKAFQIFSDSFCSMFIRSFRELSRSLEAGGWPQDRKFFQAVVLHFSTAFRNFRAAEIVAVKGYPFSGYSLLRDLLERAVFLSAVQNKVVAFEQVCMGARSLSLSETDRSTAATDRRKAEWLAIDSIIGKKSGFSSEAIKCLEKWRSMFHDEVHGSKYTHVLGHDKWVNGTGPLTFSPAENDLSTSLYAQNFCAVAWLWLRLLPSLQPRSGSFSMKWREDLVAIDSIACKFVYGDGREMLASIVQMTEQKFCFEPNTKFEF